MKPDHCQALNSILHQSQTSLKKLVEKGNQLQRINQQLQSILSPELKGSCQVANLKEGCLIIAASNASALTYLRFSSTEILVKLHEQGLKFIQQIRCINSTPPAQYKQTQQRDKPSLSSHSANLIQTVANTIEDDGLKLALTKLAGLGNKKST